MHFPLCWTLLLPLLALLQHWNGNVQAEHQIGDDVGHQFSAESNELLQQQLPICRACNCNKRLRTVECMGSAAGGQLRLRLVRLPAWADSLLGQQLGQPEFPHFSASPQLRQLRLLGSGLHSLHPLSFVPMAGLELLQLTDNRWLQGQLPFELFQPLGQLRSLDLSGNRLSDPKLGRLAGRRQPLDRLLLGGNPLCPEGAWAQLPATRELGLEGTGLVALNGTHFTFQPPNSTMPCTLPFPEANWHPLEQLHASDNPGLHLGPEAMAKLAQLWHLDLARAAAIPEQLFVDWTQREGTRWRHLSLAGAKVVRAPAFDYFPFGNGGPLWDQRELLHRGRPARWTLCSADLEWLDLGGVELSGQLGLGGCRHLKWLFADGNQLGGLRLGDSAGPTALLTLSLRSNRIKQWPAALLAQGHSLTSLLLANNSIRHLPAGGRLLLAQFPQLQQLDLAQNRLEAHFVLDATAASSPPASPAAQLLFLNLSQNQLLSFGLKGSLPSLTVLDLSANQLAHFSSLDQLPSLQHLHLSANPGLRMDNPLVANRALISLHLANCSLAELPDLSRLHALKELNLRGNRLHAVPARYLAPKGLSTLDLRSNLVQRLGWDWSEVQLGALAELRLEANPLDCVCPMPERMAARLLRPKEADRQQQTEEEDFSSGYFCVEDANGGGHWQHRLDVFLQPTSDSSFASSSVASTSHPIFQPSSAGTPTQSLHHHHCLKRARPGPFPVGGEGQGRQSAAAEDPGLFALFLLPLLLIAGSLGAALLLLRTNPKWQELHWASTEAGSMLAYEQLVAEQCAADNV